MEHFRNLFRSQHEISIVEILQIAQMFPRFVEEEDNKYLMVEVTKGEIFEVLQSFQKYKIPRSNRWPIEFYLGFYDLIGGDLMKVVEESRFAGFIHALINSTFIALIPKVDNLISLYDFRLISLHNYLYKIISKVI